jgi:hypothetical protein
MWLVMVVGFRAVMAWGMRLAICDSLCGFISVNVHVNDALLLCPAHSLPSPRSRLSCRCLTSPAPPSSSIAVNSSLKTICPLISLQIHLTTLLKSFSASTSQLTHPLKTRESLIYWSYFCTIVSLSLLMGMSFLLI